MVFNMTHLRIYGRKIISRHFQLVRISYQKLDFHRISLFAADFIINNLNARRYNSGTMDKKSKFRFSFNNPLKESLNYFLYPWLLKHVPPSMEIIDDESSRKTTDSMKIQFLI
jgi:hypothetical protein